MCDNPDNRVSVFVDVLTSLVNSLSSNCSSNVSSLTHTHTHRDRPQLMLCFPINTERTKCTSQQSREIPVVKLTLSLCQLPLLFFPCLLCVLWQNSQHHTLSISLFSHQLCWWCTEMKMSETEILVWKPKLKVFILYLYFCLGLELLKLFILLLLLLFRDINQYFKGCGAVL